MTEKGKGTALPLAVGTIPIYVDFHPPQPGRPANKKNAQLFFTSNEHSQQSLSKYSASSPPTIIPLQTSHTKARVSHIVKVKNKSIPYHAFSLSFPLALFLPARQGEKEQLISTWNQASNQELTSWNSLHDYLFGIALEYSSSTSYTSREDTTSA
ncbi:hypothetical protein ACFX1S_003637 [Malus domestica]